MPTTTPHAVSAFSDLLANAVTEPGRIHEAYTAFHGYSLGNQLLALFQCHARGIAPGPSPPSLAGRTAAASSAKARRP